MDWLLKNPQLIVFLAIFVVVTLANRAAAKKSRDAKERSERSTGFPARDSLAPDAGRTAQSPYTAATDEDRARQVQEEIRRKILARMQTTGAPPQQYPAALSQPQYPSAMPRPQPRPAAMSQPSQQRPSAMPRPAQPAIIRTPARAIPRAGAAAATPPPLPNRQTPAASAVDAAYAQETDPSLAAYREATAELAQLEAMSQNADANRDQDFAPDTADTASTAPAPATALDDLTATLRTPATVRRAILLREILGSPPGLR